MVTPSLAEDACPLQFPEPVPSAAAAADGRGMRVRKVPKACPTCKADIADFLRTAQENREMADVIARLQRAAREARIAAGIDEAGEQVACAGLDAGSRKNLVGHRHDAWTQFMHHAKNAKMQTCGFG